MTPHPDVESTRRAIEEAVAGITEAEMTAAPDGKWSVSAVLEHLDLTYSTTATAMQKTLQKGLRPAAATLKQRLAKWLIVRLGYFPAGHQAPDFAVPQGRPGGDVLADIRRHLPEMDEAIAAFADRFGRRATVRHPRLGPLTAAQWRRFHLVHTRHHMKQVAARRAAASGRGR